MEGRQDAARERKRSRSASLSILVTVLLGGAIGVLWLGSRVGAGGEVEAPRNGQEAVASADPIAPAEEPPASEPGPDRSAAEPPAFPEPVADPDLIRGIAMTGTLEAPKPVRWQDVAAEVEELESLWGSDPDVEVSIDDAGHFRFSVSFEEGVPIRSVRADTGTTFLLTVAHPALLTREVKIQVRPRPRPPVDDVLVYELGVIPMEEASGVHGRVLGPSGEGLPGCSVVVYPDLEEAQDRGETLYAQRPFVTVTDGEGRFSIRLEEQGSALVLAYGPRHRPRARPVELAHDEPVHLEFYLDEGLAFSGRFGGEGVAKVRCLLVPRVRDDDRVSLSTNDGSFDWTPGQGTETIQRWVETDDQGRFHIGGLTPGDYYLIAKPNAITGPGGRRRTFNHMHAPFELWTELRAPAEGLRLEPRVSIVQLEFRRDGSPLEYSECDRMRLELTTPDDPEDSDVLPVYSPGYHYFTCPPRSRYIASVRLDGEEVTTLSIDVPGPGETTRQVVELGMQ